MDNDGKIAGEERILESVLVYKAGGHSKST